MFSINSEVRTRQNPQVLMVLGLFSALVGLLLPACSDDSEPVAVGDPVVHTYSLRGEIVSLPDSADPASELRIRHEAIHDFKDAKGNIDPMHAMTMSFSPATESTLDGLAVGDAVEFEFHMHYAPSLQMQADAFNKLPEGTELNFDDAHSHGHEHDHDH